MNTVKKYSFLLFYLAAAFSLQGEIIYKYKSPQKITKLTSYEIREYSDLRCNLKEIKIERNLDKSEFSRISPVTKRLFLVKDSDSDDILDIIFITDDLKPKGHTANDEVLSRLAELISTIEARMAEQTEKRANQ